MEEKLNWKQKFAAYILLIIGFGLLGIEALAIISSKASFGSQTDTTVSVNKGELFAHSRTFIILLLCFVAAVALLKSRTVGWILGVPLLIISAAISGYLIYFGYIMYGSTMSIIAGVLFVIILCALLILLSLSTRLKYKVGKRTALPTLVFLMALCAIFFFLQ